MLQGGLPDEAEGDAVKVLGGPVLYVAKVEAHHQGVMAGDVFDVRALKVIGLPVFHFPGVAVRKVVLVAVGNLALLCKGEKLLHESVLWSIHFLFTGAGA